MNLSEYGMHSPYFANLLIPFCEAASINYRMVEDTLKKRFIVSFIAYIEPERIHDIVFPNAHLDWVNVKQYLSEVRYNTSDWIQLISIMDFSNEIKGSQQIQEMISSSLAGIQVYTVGKHMTPIETMKLSFAKAGISPSWDTVCKALISSTISDIDLHQIFTYLLSSTPSTESNTVNELTKHISSICKHSAKEYHDIFLYIFSKENCHIRSHVLIKSLEARDKIKEEKRISRLNVLNQFKKPSLSQIMEMSKNHSMNLSQINKKFAQANSNINIGPCNGTENVVHSKLQYDETDVDMFNKFCELARFPIYANMHIKRIIYCLKCIPKERIKCKETFQNIMLRIVGNDTNSLKYISSTEIINPDIQALKMLLGEIYYVGIPFSNLKIFNQKCVSQSFNYYNNKNSKQSMNWSIIFRLYLSSYFAKEITKDLWIYILSIANEKGDDGNIQTHCQSLNVTSTVKYKLASSVETENNIELFINEYPLNIEEIVNILINNLDSAI
jgi:hypothetical protein